MKISGGGMNTGSGEIFETANTTFSELDFKGFAFHSSHFQMLILVLIQVLLH